MTSSRFDKVLTELDFPRDERAILSFWKEQRIFEKSLERTASLARRLSRALLRRA